jgi:hypothetical protein
MRAIFLSALLLAGCGDAVRQDDLDNSLKSEEAAPDTVTVQATPVRIGEYGPNFKACPTDGATRNVDSGETLPVRSAPFDAGTQTGALPAGARFFVCSRSLDQKWFGIVYDESLALAPRCGVSDPVNARHAYAGPCRSGWVASAFVKLIAGIDQPPNQPAAPAQTTDARPEPAR